MFHNVNCKLIVLITIFKFEEDVKNIPYSNCIQNTALVDTDPYKVVWEYPDEILTKDEFISGNIPISGNVEL